MSLRLNGTISDIFFGSNKINSAWFGEDLVYGSMEKLTPLCFTLDENSSQAEVSFAFEAFSTDQRPEAPAVDLTRFTKYNVPSFEYSFDNKTWVDYTHGTPIVLTNNNKRVYFRGDNLGRWFDSYSDSYVVGSSTRPYTCLIFEKCIINSGYVHASGSVLSLRYVNYENITDISNLPVSSFVGLFNNATNLKSAPSLPATILGAGAYGGVSRNVRQSDGSSSRKTIAMFAGCTSLTTAPELPATTLASNCYGYMFEGCTSLTTPPPELPATTLVSTCYNNMFEDCTSLTTAPELPAMTLADNCYNSMFKGCTSLTTPPELPATTLAESCYVFMFENCTSLTTAPELPAMTLAIACYTNMFSGCTSLTTPPELPATTLTDHCYYYMFSRCTSLTTAPELSVTTLARYCYMGMFYDCASLTTTPELPVTTLTKQCYCYMFAGCTSLTTPPELPATTLAEGCYNSMFSRCTSLTKIPKLNALKIEDDSYRSMYEGSNIRANASSSGVCNKAYRIPTSGSGTAGSKSMDDMFVNLAGTVSFTPSINTTFYINVPSF